MDAISITVATPITTPRMVRKERSLLVRSASRATATPSSRLRRITAALLLPERGDGIEPGGAGGGVDAEEDTAAAAPGGGAGRAPGGAGGGIAAEENPGAGAGGGGPSPRPGRDPGRERAHRRDEL